MAEENKFEQLSKKDFLQKLPQIDLANLVSSGVDASGETPDDFKCNICLRLVYDP